MRHPAFDIPTTIINGLDVVECRGAPYIRAIAAGKVLLVVPTNPAELHRLARQWEEAAVRAELQL